MARKPHAVFIVAGDFNTAVQPIRHLHSTLEPGVMTFRRTIRGRTVQSRTDWVLCSQNLQHITECQWTEHSDHCVIMTVLQIPNMRPRATHIRVPNAEAAKELCVQAEEETTTIEEFFALHRTLAAKQTHMKRIRIALRQKKEQEIQDLAGFAKLIDEHLRTARSKVAFNLVNRLSIVHPTKRDGGIMQCFLSAQDEQLIVGQEQVLRNCLRQLQVISGAAAPRDVRDINFPSLPPLSID